MKNIIVLFLTIFYNVVDGISQINSVYYHPTYIYERYYNKTICFIDGFNIGNYFIESDDKTGEIYFPCLLYNFYYKNLLYVNGGIRGVTSKIRYSNTFGNDSLNATILYLYSMDGNDGYVEINDRMLLVISPDSVKNLSYYINDELVKDSFKTKRLMKLKKDEVDDYYYDKINNSIYIKTK